MGGIITKFNETKESLSQITDFILNIPSLLADNTISLGHNIVFLILEVGLCGIFIFSSYACCSIMFCKEKKVCANMNKILASMGGYYIIRYIETWLKVVYWA